MHVTTYSAIHLVYIYCDSYLKIKKSKTLPYLGIHPAIIFSVKTRRIIKYFELSRSTCLSTSSFSYFRRRQRKRLSDVCGGGNKLYDVSS